MRKKGKKMSRVVLSILMLISVISIAPIMAMNVNADAIIEDPYIDITFDQVTKENKNHGTLYVFKDNETGAYGNDTVTYGFDDDGTYMAWTSSFLRGGGFNLNVDKAIGDEYTIALKFSFADTGEISGRWKKIIDFQKTGSHADSGLYFYAKGKTQFYPEPAQGPQIKNNKVVDLLIRRNKETNKFEVYNRVGNNSVLCYEFTDINGLSILDMGLGFFHDDYATSGENTNGGKVYSVKIWDSWIEVNDVWDFLDKERDAIVYYYKYFNGGSENLSFAGNGDFSFTVDGDYLLLKDVKVNDTTFVRNEDYVVSYKKGTLITFTKKGLTKLNTLSKGEYEISVSYTNNEEVTGKIVLENGPLHVAVDTNDKIEYFYEGVTESKDETVIYDSINHTLTLNNYNGGPISYYEDEDLTLILKGTNTIISDGTENGITAYNSGLTISGNGSLSIKNVKNGISIENDNLNINSGNITITDAIESGITSNGNIAINGGNIDLNANLYGLHSIGKIDINGGKTIISSDSYGIFSNYSFNEKDGYLEINTPADGTGAAIFVASDDLNSLNLSNNLKILPNEISKQKVLTTPDDKYIITLGKEGASANIESESKVHVSNIVNSVKIYSEKVATFNSNGGSFVDIQNIVYGSTIGELTNPTKEGYTFAGWYEDATLTVPFDLDTPLTADVTLYAKWEINEFTITVNVDDEDMGIASASLSTATHGTQISLTATANDGYHFVEWKSTDVDASTGQFEMPNHNVIVEAIFAVNATYKITFDVNGGAGSMESIVLDPLTDSLPDYTLEIPKGKKFKGWSLSSDGEIITSVNELTSDSTLYAIWENSYDYEFIKGDNQKLVIDDISGYTFTISGDYSLFESVSIGNLDLIRDEDYIVTEGSTIITFTTKGIAKLNTLPQNDYEILVTYSNGKKVTGKVMLNTIIENPKTSDNINSYIIIGIISALGLISSIFFLKKDHIKR